MIRDDNAGRTLLVAEDSDEDFEMLMWAFKKAEVKNPVLRATGGDELLEMLRAGGAGRPGDGPAFLILDLNLVGTDGREVLREIRGDPVLNSLPVMVLSTSNNPRDVEFCYRHGANCYFVKPVDRPRLERLAVLFREFWVENAIWPGSPGAARTREGLV